MEGGVVRPHHKFDVLRKAVDFVKHVYVLTSRFPAEEKFGLFSQMRRAAVSIPSNISEGAARQTNPKCPSRSVGGQVYALFGLISIGRRGSTASC
jgi:hypothetical protein